MSFGQSVPASGLTNKEDATALAVDLRMPRLSRK